MKRVYEVPLMKSLDEEQVAASLGPVMLSETNLIAVESLGASSTGAIHGPSVAGGGGGSSYATPGAAPSPTHMKAPK